MAYLKSDFLNMLVAEAMTRPAAAEAYQAGDPRLVVVLNSQAAMLAALSAQIDMAEVEPFLKSRDGTVLADAALKGILPLAKPARVQLNVASTAASAVALAVGRKVVDNRGRVYVIDGAASVPAGGAAVVTAAQVATRTAAHTVAGSSPFYSVQIGESDEDLLLCGLSVSSTSGAYTYTEDFCNVMPGDRVYHVETDEARRLWVRFGAADSSGDVVGHQPVNGEVLTFTISECAGAVELSAGANFALESVLTSDEAALKLTLANVLSPGADQPSMEFLRVMARYPGAHDSNAVFLGDFDFLLRRKLSGFEFLSVWNEQAEEAARGASVNNINKLFVSFSAPGYTVADMQNRIRAVVARADDSYRVVFVPMVDRVILAKVTARVAAVHDVADVQAQVRTILLANYGRGTASAATGLLKSMRIQDIHAKLRAGVPALQDQISDFSVTIDAGTGAVVPEDFRYMTAGSVLVTVTQASDSMGLWSA